jgi:hypothetical protein
VKRDEIRNWVVSDPQSGLDYEIVYRPSYIAVQTHIADEWTFGRQTSTTFNLNSHLREDKEWLVTFDDRTQMRLMYFYAVDCLTVSFRNNSKDTWTRPLEAKEKR